jgi:glutamate synthase (ferredoxin)
MLPAKQGLYDPQYEHENCGAGFICNLNGEKSNEIIHDALEILVKLEHRGGVSSDGKTGDGAGLLIDIPHNYFERVCEFKIPKPREYAVGMIFLPKHQNQYEFCKQTLEKEIKSQGLNILGWRKVPVDSSNLGEIAYLSEPNIEQVFVSKTEETSELNFKAKLYAARKVSEHIIRQSKISESSSFYIPSLSITTIIYKGIIKPEDIEPYYTDLQQKDLVTRLALVHQRFSTNTMPSWDLAQPIRFI